MKRAWFGVREPAVADAFGARLDAQVPMRVSGAVPLVSGHRADSRSWWAPMLRLLRNALIGAVGMALIPLATVAVRGDHLASVLSRSGANTVERRRVIAEPVRPFGLAHDPSITPAQAGAALNTLQYRHSSVGEFTAIRPSQRYARPWRVNAVAPDLFKSSRPDMYEGPSSRYILEAAAKGLSPREQAYLKEMAEAPIWREFDMVARAPAVDMVGGQLRLPFGPNALSEQRPLPSYKDSKELAYAAVARAAYYMSIGKPHEAEAVLRSIVSFGFAFIDNGTTTMDELIGTVDVGIGRDALRRFYALQHDPRATLPALASLRKTDFHWTSGTPRGSRSPDDVRRELLARLGDPALPRPERLEVVKELTLMQCTTARGLLFGQTAEVRDAIERTASSFPRYPSERALMELETRLPSAEFVSSMTGPVESIIVSPAVVAGAVVRNPRLGVCTLLLTSAR